MTTVKEVYRDEELQKAVSDKFTYDWQVTSQLAKEIGRAEARLEKIIANTPADSRCRIDAARALGRVQAAYTALQDTSM